MKDTNLIEFNKGTNRVVMTIEEYKKLYKLAEIGRATEKAFDKTHQAMFVTYWQEEEGGEHYVDMNSSFNFNSVENLLNWAKED